VPSSFSRLFCHINGQRRALAGDHIAVRVIRGGDDNGIRRTRRQGFDQLQLRDAFAGSELLGTEDFRFPA
jgi:hypothetical protein